MTVSSTCPGCHMRRPLTGGVTHTYIVSSPECWALFGVLQTTNSERLFTDAYMAQHPAGQMPQQIQSVAVHLITLGAVLERGQPESKASEISRHAVAVGKRSGCYTKLEEPKHWPMTIEDIELGAVSTKEYVRGIFDVWRDHVGGQIEDWTGRTLEELYKGS
ncbi:MAG: DUF5946 family protein [Acidimicrobiia bacterium]